MNVFTGKIVGDPIDSPMNASLAVHALDMAVTHRGKPADVVAHSDRGGQFWSKKFVTALQRHGLRGSMGRVGACSDNAAMESILQPVTEEHPRPASVDDAPTAPTHNRALDRGDLPPQAPTTLSRTLTPVEFETRMMDAVALAA